MKLENKNFGNNNFNLFYDYDFSKNLTKVMIKGQKFYAGGFLQSKILSQKNHKRNHKSNLFDNLFLFGKYDSVYNHILNISVTNVPKKLSSGINSLIIITFF